MDDDRFLKWLREEEKKYARMAEKMGERQESFTSASGIPIKRIYTPLDWNPKEYMEKLGFPGGYPYTRGVYETMHRGRLWTMRQESGFGLAEDGNARFKFLMKNGITGLSAGICKNTDVSFRDIDDPAFEEELGVVGITGISSPTLVDHEILFNGIPLDQVTLSINESQCAARNLAQYLGVAQKQGVPLANLRGTCQNDPLQVYHSIHYPIFPPEHSMRMTVNVIQFACQNMPLWNPISISGYNVAESGIPPVVELAFALADGIAYIEACLKAGLPIDQFAPRIAFFFSSADDFFEEIAKFRAARRMWAKIMKERFGAKDPKSMRLRFHVQTAGSTLTAQQPYNNIIRSAVEGLAAILGGAQSLHIDSMDEALAVPSEEAAIIALRTQQILAHEFNIPQTIDPLGGSFFMESLTDQVEEKAFSIIRQIDDIGGVLPAIKKNYFLNEISKQAWDRQKKVNSKEKIVVGVNEFQMEEKSPIKILDFDKKKALETVRKRVARIRKERDPQKFQKAIDHLRRAASGQENIVYPLLEAFECLATTAEINRALRDIFGEYTHPMVL